MNWSMYGLEFKTLEEELNLPASVNQTRGNKIKIVDWCEHIKRIADMVAERAKRIPEEDNTDHANLVQTFADKVRKAGMMLDDAYMVGFISEQYPEPTTEVVFTGKKTGDTIEIQRYGADDYGACWHDDFSVRGTLLDIIKELGGEI